MNMNISSHQFFTDESGVRKSVLLSYEEYQKMLEIVKAYDEYVSFETSMIESLKELKAIRKGEQKGKLLQSLIDEL